MTTAIKLKKGDTVQMLTGKDRGKQGRILDARPRDGKVIVENLNVDDASTRSRARSATRAAWAARRSRRAAVIENAAAVVRVERDARLPDVQAADARRLPVQGRQGRQTVKVRVCKRDGCGQEIDR